MWLEMKLKIFLCPPSHEFCFFFSLMRGKKKKKGKQKTPKQNPTSCVALIFRCEGFKVSLLPFWPWSWAFPEWITRCPHWVGWSLCHSCEVLEDSALDSEMLQSVLDTLKKSSEQYEMFINWEMHMSYAEMDSREKLVRGAETQALLAEDRSLFAKGRDQSQTKFLPALTKLHIALDISLIKSSLSSFKLQLSVLELNILSTKLVTWEMTSI